MSKTSNKKPWFLDWQDQSVTPSGRQGIWWTDYQGTTYVVIRYEEPAYVSNMDRLELHRGGKAPFLRTSVPIAESPEAAQTEALLWAEDQILSDLEHLALLGSEAKENPKRQKKGPKIVTRSEAERVVDLLTQAARQALAHAPHWPPWSRKSHQEREDLTQEVLTLWLAENAPGGTLPQLKATATSLRRRDPEAISLLHDMEKLATLVARTREEQLQTPLRDLSRLPQAELQVYATPAPTPETDIEERASEAARARMAEAYEATLGLFSAQTADLIKLHLGEDLVEGLPYAFHGPRPHADFVAYHVEGKAGRCPTCNRILRYARTPGLDLERLTSLLQRYASEVTQATLTVPRSNPTGRRGPSPARRPSRSRALPTLEAGGGEAGTRTTTSRRGR